MSRERKGAGWMLPGLAGVVGSGLGLAAVGLDVSMSVRALLVAGAMLAAASAMFARSVATRRDLARRHDKLSQDLGVVSDRLLRLEGAPPTVLRDADVARDVETLSRIVTDLAEAVDRQADRLDALDRAEFDRSRAAAATPAPALPAAPDVPRIAATDVPQSVRPPAPPPLLPPLDIPPAELRPVWPATPSPAIEAERQEAMLAAFDSGRLELFLQPAVTLPQRRPRLYEALARLRLADDSVIAPGEFLPAIERNGRILRLDETVLGRAIQIAGHLASRNSSASIAFNLSPETIRDPRALTALEARLGERPEAARRLVLEIAQPHWASFGRAEAQALGRLRALGATFSVDGVTELRVDWAALAGHGVAFVKVPAGRLLEDGVAPALRQVLERGGIQLVAERVERDDMIPDLIELDVPLAQGFAIERPRPVKPDILEPGETRAAEPPTEPTPSRSQALAKVAMSYRDYLRRTG